MCLPTASLFGKKVKRTFSQDQPFCELIALSVQIETFVHEIQLKQKYLIRSDRLSSWDWLYVCTTVDGDSFSFLFFFLLLCERWRTLDRNTLNIKMVDMHCTSCSFSSVNTSDGTNRSTFVWIRIFSVNFFVFSSRMEMNEADKHVHQVAATTIYFLINQKMNRSLWRMGSKNYRCIWRIGNYPSRNYCDICNIENSSNSCFSHREEITAERLTPFRVFIIANPRDKFTTGEVSRISFELYLNSVVFIFELVRIDETLHWQWWKHFTNTEWRWRKSTIDEHQYIP